MSKTILLIDWQSISCRADAYVYNLDKMRRYVSIIDVGLNKYDKIKFTILCNLYTLITVHVSIFYQIGFHS